MANSTLILGDILVNTINGKKLPKNFEYIIDNTKIDSSGKISILFSELNISNITNFSILYNNEIYYPDIKWFSNSVQLDFGKAVNSQDNIKIIFIQNI